MNRKIAFCFSLFAFCFLLANICFANDTLYMLNADKRNITLPIDKKITHPEKYKFIQVEVSKVNNHQRIPVIFQVEYEYNNNKTLLGTFSLYPSDNPGKFIVATQGKVKRGGNIILSVQFPEKSAIEKTFQVTVKKIELINK